MAQRMTTRRNGTLMRRIPFGNEARGVVGTACGDCGVPVGALHLPDCDLEQCPACGGQYIACECTSNASKPAKPFSAREQAIVDARQRFVWKHVGYADNGDAVFEVSNRSKTRLPFLSIGLRGPKLIGGAWLDVAGIGPGEAGRVQHRCYKDILPNEAVQFFDIRGPTPETRDEFWEFRRLPRKRKGASG